MANNRYIITKSNYTLKEKHKQLKNGDVIYERDYMVTTNLGGYDSGSIPHEEFNFKFVYNQNENNTRSFNNGKYLEHDGSPIWTLNDLNCEDKNDSSSNIIIKPNRNTFKDFVYFGSCVELLKASLLNIIKFYPAELYVTDQQYVYGNGEILGSEAFEHPVIVSNPFNINITTKKIDATTKQSNDYNELRYFAESFSQYESIYYDGEEEYKQCFCGWNVVIKDKECYETGELVSNTTLTRDDTTEMVILEYIFPQGSVFITSGEYSGTHIRPSEKQIDKVFDEKLSDFDRFLLDRYSKPMYTMSIDVPSETEYGIGITRRSFTMPLEYEWNIALESGEYSSYVNQLMRIAEFYDTHYSDNLWSNIVHEAIKNKDAMTTSNETLNEDVDDYVLGIGNIHGFMLACARQFDDIKLTIDNIKFNNTITYDENDNIPDYFLSDVLELSGWEVISPTKDLDDTVSVDNLFPGNNMVYTTGDAATTFMRNLKLNSKSIFSRKGNRQSIEMLMSLFGMSSYEYGRNYYNCLPESSKIISGGTTLQWEDLTEEQKSYFYDYKFDEYVVVAKNTAEDVVDKNEFLCVEEINQQIKGDRVISVVDGLDNEEYELVNSVVGLPVRLVYLTNPDETVSKYIIPWFDKETEYDGKTYFQMYGGWCKIEAEDPYYSETLKYLNIVDNLAKLQQIPQSRLVNGEIYYVKNIGDYNDYFVGYTGDTPSNYFYIGNIEKSYKFKDYTDPDSEGWEIITQADVNDKVRHGIQVYQLESIINEYRGNNPHVGYGKYDNGDKYLERLSHLFDGAIDDGLFDDCVYTCNGDEIPMEDIKNIGFEITDKLIDNVKCWYFVDNSSVNKVLDLRKTYVTTDEGDEIFNGYEEKPYQKTIYVGSKALQNGDVHMTTELDAFNFETQEVSSNDEAAANSIINVKNITIEFNELKYHTTDFEKYLKDVILFYLNQIIPSTSILDVVYYINDEVNTEQATRNNKRSIRSGQTTSDNNTYGVCYSTPVITGVS